MGETVSADHAMDPRWSASPSDLRRSGSVGAGVFLVLIGVAFLAAQTVPGVTVWELWPLLIVAAGIVQIVVPSPYRGWGIERVSDGLGTVLVGIILLGNTTGVIGWEMWLVALSLWPVLLISAGIGILGKAAGQAWIRALAPVIIWAALVYSASTALTGTPVPSDILVLLGLN